jgi:acetyl-CoA C-acetyltransferase
MMKEIAIVSGARTPIGTFGGSLRDIPVVNLGSLVIKEALKRAELRPKSSKKLLNYGPNIFNGEGISELEAKYYDWNPALQEIQVDEVIMGNALQGGQGQNTARQAAIRAGIPKETPAYAVNKICASGLKAITLGAEAIMLGEAEVVVAGGMENMSHCPYVLPKARWGYRMSIGTKADIVDLMVLDTLWDAFYGYHMGNTAENIASKYNISREEQDEVGLLSHQRAKAAIREGIFKQEIVPVPVPQRRGGPPIYFDTDERPMDTSLERMALLPPVFQKGGTVTAGNSSGINDAAAAVVLMSSNKAKALGLEPWVTIKSYASAAVDPAYMGLGAIPATRKALRKARLTIKDIDLVELNEVFAAQAIACMRELGISWNNTNPHGSGIALGHPIGATGARLVVTAMHDMKQKNLHYGVVTTCVGGGQGMAVILERKA